MNGTGWLPDSLDTNDYTLKTDKINALIRQIQILRGFDDFLESLENSLEPLDQVPDKPSNPFSGLWTSAANPWRNFLDNLKFEVRGENITPQFAIARLRGDIDILLRGLASGIDLIAAGSNPGAQKYQPLLPPISAEVLHMFQDLGVINNQKNGEKTDYDFEDSALMAVRRILHKIAPLGKYGKGEALAAAIQKNYRQEGYDLDLSSKSLEPRNIIQIDPNTMYNLVVKEPSNDSEAGSSNLESDKAMPPLRIPLSSSLSRQLREKTLYNYVLPDVVDLSYWCSDIKEQKSFNSCTSHAVTSLVEYFQNRGSDQSNSAFKPASLSARFLYKVSRHLGVRNEAKNLALKASLKDKIKLSSSENIEQQVDAFLKKLDSLRLDFFAQKQEIEEYIKEDKIQDFSQSFFDVGASIRQTLKALQLFGIPPERYWSYDVDSSIFDNEPPQFCYAFAQNYQKVKYFRLDPVGDLGEDYSDERYLILTQIKAVLAAGFPTVCGFLYDPISGDKSAEISIPSQDKIDEFKKYKNKSQSPPSKKFAGHAVLVVGYSDVKTVKSQKGAFLFQNSYGKEWGDGGYGWLPYEFVLRGIATDWWSLLNSEWVEVGDFGLDSSWGDQKTPIPKP